MSYVVILLLKNPRVLKKLKEEVDHAQIDQVTGLISASVAKNLSYLHCESLISLLFHT